MIEHARWERLKSVFAEAHDLEASARADYLHAACADDPELQREVEALLAADDGAEAFLEPPAASRVESALETSEPDVRAGARLGPWALEPLKARLSNRHWVQSIAQARVWDPDGAVEAGFLDEVVPAGEAVARACSLAAELGELPAKPYAINKLSTRKESIAIMQADLPAD